MPILNDGDILSLLRENFPDCWFKPGHEFDGRNAVAWSGGDGTITVNEEKWKAFDSQAYEFDADENLYVMDVKKELEDFVTKLGCYWEAYDAETFFLYRI